MHARVCAAVALISAAAHVWMGWEHRAVPWQGVVMLAMAAACLPCAVGLWRSTRGEAVATVRPARVLMAMAAVMAAVHAVLLLAPSVLGGSSGHHHGAGPGQGSGPAPDGAAMMLALIAVELVVAMLAATLIRSHGGPVTVRRPATVRTPVTVRIPAGPVAGRPSDLRVPQVR